MSYINRQILKPIKAALNRDKSVLLLGPRQTGKTTLIQHQLQPDITYSFAQIESRLYYEKNPILLAQELSLEVKKYKKKPLVFIDEVQKIPLIMDVAQDLIDRRLAQFILSGSSARKLRQGAHVNLLPGRVVSLVMDPLVFSEIPTPQPSLEDLLLYGSLPGIVTLSTNVEKETDLHSYVSTYLEEEVRAEALVRNVGNFARFLELAASESAMVINFTSLSQQVGVASSTIADYYQILEDCLIVNRVDPIIHSVSHRRLIKSPKYLFFDLGIRRACANEGIKLPRNVLGRLFEQYVGIELMRIARLSSPQIKLKYWRDTAGPEIDFVLDIAHHYIPVEVKLSENPNVKDTRHLQKFMQEYAAEKGYIICTTPRPYQLTEKIIALPWQDIETLF